VEAIKELTVKLLKTATAAACAVILLASVAQAAAPMLDPATDRADGPWCYLAKSTTVIGVPFQPDVTQITFDGAVFTRNAELCFLYGPEDRPLLAREKTFLDGWIPVVQYAWRDGEIAYDIEYFAAPLEGESAENTVNFVQLRMRNTGKQRAAGAFAAALRHSGGDCRFGRTRLSPLWKYEMTDSTAARDGKLTYAFSPSARREAVPGASYEAPFLGIQYGINARSACCLARYGRTLQPNESFAATFKMPRVPTADAGYLAKVAVADYATYRARTVAWWQTLLDRGAIFEFPEKCVQDAQRASLVHVLLATRTRNGRPMQTDGLPYPDFFVTSMPQAVLCYLQSGHFDRAKAVVEYAVHFQTAGGLFQDAALAHGVEIPAGHGQAMFAAAMTILYSQDRQFAEKIYPRLAKAVQYLADSIAKDEYGLLPPAYPYDNEMIKGHYTSNNLWGLLGLRSLARVARFLGRTKDAADWTELESRYAANIRKGIEASAKRDGYVPPGLYKYLTGAAGRSGFPEWQTNHDWENMLLAFPSELLPPADPRVRGTVDHIRKNYAEGVMPYRQYMHQYITANQTEQYLAMGDSLVALKDFYHILLHTGSTFEGFENLVRPWSDRMVDAGCPPPHAWASSKLACLIRDMVLLEYGGQAGLEPGKRELWLFHCLSPAWTVSGKRIAIKNGPTEFGVVDAVMTFRDSGASVTIAGRFHDQPAACRVRVPYFKELIGFVTDAKTSRRDGDCILVSPDATKIAIEWRDRPAAHLHTVENILTEYRSANFFRGVDLHGAAVVEAGKPFLLESEKSDRPQPLSFALVRETFQHEYARRAAGASELVRVEAPPLAAPRPGGPAQVPSLLTGAKATATASEPGFGPEKAIDGDLQLESSWRASPYPQTLNIELDKPRKLRGLRVWPYWGNGRYYQYLVEISTDGKNWTLAGDRSQNTSPATEAGEQFAFDATDVRFIRVKMLYNSLNQGVHVVEVMGIEAKPLGPQVADKQQTEHKK
jgi:hypothetical protein